MVSVAFRNSDTYLSDNCLGSIESLQWSTETGKYRNFGIFGSVRSTTESLPELSLKFFMDVGFNS